MSDQFDKLLPCKWRGIEFPVRGVKIDVSHDVAEHKKTDRDGARLEPTGRNPAQFQVDALFINGLAPGKNETWRNAGALYPDVWRLMMAALADRKAGDFQHPEFGVVTCVPVSFSTTLAADRRGGAEISFSLKETEDEHQTPFDTFDSGSAGLALESSAIDLDAQVVARNITSRTGVAQPSFLDAIRKITAIVGKASLLSKQSFGSINHVIFQLDSLEFALDSLADVNDWPVRNASSRLKDALIQKKLQAQASQKDVSLFIVPKDMAIAAVANRLKQSISDLIDLNPDVATSAIVKERTVIRYYKVS